jgi:hypothetical protein
LTGSAVLKNSMADRGDSREHPAMTVDQVTRDLQDMMGKFAI